MITSACVRGVGPCADDAAKRRAVSSLTNLSIGRGESPLGLLAVIAVAAGRGGAGRALGCKRLQTVAPASCRSSPPCGRGNNPWRGPAWRWRGPRRIAPQFLRAYRARIAAHTGRRA
eukprot:scaffold2536_cov378-Prasinococcus_capsulatus_cf.AAC.1